eukprot:1077728-Amphidinium_carterae.1
MKTFETKRQESAILNGTSNPGPSACASYSAYSAYSADFLGENIVIITDGHQRGCQDQQFVLPEQAPARQLPA